MGRAVVAVVPVAVILGPEETSTDVIVPVNDVAMVNPVVLLVGIANGLTTTK